MVDFLDDAGQGFDLPVYPLLDEVVPAQRMGDDSRLHVGFSVRVPRGRTFCVKVYDASGLCEGGFALARALADEGLADACHAVLSPVVIGSRPLADARRFPSPVRVETAGPDVLALYRL
jgi:hypothetical protein